MKAEGRIGMLGVARVSRNGSDATAHNSAPPSQPVALCRRHGIGMRDQLGAFRDRGEGEADRGSGIVGVACDVDLRAGRVRGSFSFFFRAWE